MRNVKPQNAVLAFIDLLLSFTYFLCVSRFLFIFLARISRALGWVWHVDTDVHADISSSSSQSSVSECSDGLSIDKSQVSHIFKNPWVLLMVATSIEVLFLEGPLLVSN